MVYTLHEVLTRFILTEDQPQPLVQALKVGSANFPMMHTFTARVLIFQTLSVLLGSAPYHRLRSGYVKLIFRALASRLDHNGREAECL